MKPNTKDTYVQLILIVATLIFTQITILYADEINNNYHNIQFSDSQASKILQKMLPQAALEKLIAGESSIAENFDVAGILFADIVDFTKISSRISAQTTIKMLNDLYSNFDVIAEKYGVYKIETIGDCYMCSVGVPQEATTELANLAEFAQEIINYAKTVISPLGSPLQLRIGIHAGPVTGGIIGSTDKGPRYHLFGDTVNFASRMESTGLCGRIQISQDLYEKLAHSFIFSKREDVFVKGIGYVNTYILERKKSANLDTILANVQYNAETINYVNSCDFDALDKTRDQLFSYLFTMFKQLPCLQALNLTDELLAEFLIEVSNNYYDKPYHNLAHATSVTHFTFKLIQEGHFEERLSSIELSALIIAALCHDIGHPGLNNNFQYKTQTDLFKKYGKPSSLERFHITILTTIFDTILLPHISQILKSSDIDTMKNIFQTSILATDISFHQSIMSTFNTTPYMTNLMIASLIIKCADLSNTTLPHEYEERWAAALAAELAAQNEQEELCLNEQRSPFNTFSKSGYINDNGEQICFFKIIALPLFQVLTREFTKTNYLNDRILKNIDYYTEQLKKETERTSIDLRETAQKYLAPHNPLFT